MRRMCIGMGETCIGMGVGTGENVHRNRCGSGCGNGNMQGNKPAPDHPRVAQSRSGEQRKEPPVRVRLRSGEPRKGGSSPQMEEARQAKIRRPNPSRSNFGEDGDSWREL